PAPAIHRDRAVLDLPSFPTRRSSDLWAPVLLRLHGAGIRVVARPGHVRERDLEAPGRSTVRLPRRLAGGPVRPAPPDDRRHPDGDRKSTRLNSSHRTISYAVFCLKKK